MQGFLLGLTLAGLPAAGNLLGGIAAECFSVSQRGLSLALHLAAGIVLTVVGFELMPEALTDTVALAPPLGWCTRRRSC